MKLRYKLLAFLGVFLCFSSLAFGQTGRRVNNYIVTTFSSTFNSIVGSANAVGLSSNDDGNGSFSIPFAFNYDSVSFAAGTTGYICSNGFFSIGLNTGSGCCSNYLGNSSFANSMMLICRDMFLPNGATAYYIVTGTAPNRVLIVEWSNITICCQSTNTSSFQLKLYETTNYIEFCYKDWGYNFGTSALNAGTGLNGTTTGGFKYAPFNGVQNASSTPSSNIQWKPTPPPPNVQLGLTPNNPKSYNFGSLGTGSVATTAITATNVGNNNFGIAKLSIKSVSITGDPDYTITSVPASSDSILIGDSRLINVRFSPITAGLRQATVTIVTNGIDSGTQSFVLQGIGLAPLISVDTNIIFKNQFVKLGQTLTKRILITSTNSPTLLLNGFQFVGMDSGEYYISGYPSSMAIPGGTSDSIFITYRPTKEGRHVATMNILNNSINNPILPITLYGTGILPHIVVTPRPVRFDSIGIGQTTCQDISIYNPGTDTLLILRNLMTSNDGDFAFTPLNVALGDTIIPPDKTKKITVCFTPKQMGSRTARITLATNIPKTFESIPRDTASLFNIDITGAGVPYGVLSQTFSNIEGLGLNDSTLVNTSICATDTIRNNGDADLTVTALHVGGQDSATFTVTGQNVPFVIKAHSYVVVTVCGTPKERGAHIGQLSISATTNSKLVSSTSNLNVYGLIACAQATPDGLFRNVFVPVDSTKEECVTVKNCGDITAIYSASVAGAKASNYTVTPSSSLAVKPGDSATFCVKYLAIDTGMATANLNISAADIQPMSVSLNAGAGCAIVTGTIDLTADSVNAGGHYTVLVTLTNSGDYTWTPGLPVIGGPDAGVFTPKNPNALVPIPPQGSIQLLFDFSPTLTQHQYQATISFPGTPNCTTTPTDVVFNRTTGVASVRQTMQDGFSLGQNHPNPFAATSEISFTTPKEAMVSISLRDLSGKLVKMLQSGRVSAGEHTLTIEAANLASGTYVLVLESGAIQLVRTVIIDK